MSDQRLTESDIRAALARMTPDDKAFLKKLPPKEGARMVELFAFFPEIRTVEAVPTADRV